MTSNCCLTLRTVEGLRDPCSVRGRSGQQVQVWTGPLPLGRCGHQRSVEISRKIFQPFIKIILSLYNECNILIRIWAPGWWFSLCHGNAPGPLQVSWNTELSLADQIWYSSLIGRCRADLPDIGAAVAEGRPDSLAVLGLFLQVDIKDIKVIMDR